jgi:hypothetical protein
MDAKEKEIRLKLRDNFPHYAKKCLKIRTKEGAVESFTMNKAQQHIHERVELQKALTGKVRAMIVKGRQQGCSTLISGRFYHITSHHRGKQAFILTHALDATNNLFKMAQRYHEHCPPPVRPEVTTNNSKELIFGELDCGYKVGTAENKSVGRSSTIQLFHGSEVAYWANASEHAKGIMQAVPDQRGTEVFLESTANGVGNYFHEQWQLAEAGLSDFIAIFVPWFWQEEYSRDVTEDFQVTNSALELMSLHGLTHGQIAWRRAKINDLSVGGMNGEKSFMQEYPCTSTEAFQTTGEDSFISPEVVMRARKCKAEDHGALVIGVDPARFGDDRSCIIRRRNRKAYGLESYVKKDTMEITGIVHRIILEEQPHKVFIDVGGLGAGIVDRLWELGHRDIVVAVNSGNTPLDQKLYLNKRAEMWGVCKAWLHEEPCEIPDIDALHADLCSPRYKYDSNTRIIIEKKEDMKKRGIRSPDCADALCLTFSYQINPSSNIQRKKTALKITEITRKVADIRRKSHASAR